MDSANVFNEVIRTEGRLMAQHRDGWRVRIRELMVNVRSLLQLALWGTTAAGALVFAALAASSHTGSQRLSAALRTPAQASEPTKAELAARAAEAERQRLAQSVAALTTDRNRLLTRMAEIEQSLKDVTGSIKRQQAALQHPALPPVPAKSPPPATATASPQRAIPASAPTTTALAKVEAPAAHRDASTPPLPPVLPSASGQAAAVLSASVVERAAAASRRTDGELMPEESSEPEVGVDLGGSSTLEGLRALWKSVRSSHQQLLQHLHPLVTVRDNSRRRGVELRLIAGPLADAEAATRLCAAIKTARHSCRPTTYEGQKLSGRSAASAHKRTLSFVRRN
jgi:hypothetical protein